VPHKKSDALHGIGALPAGIPGRYLAGSVQETGGACLTFLRDTLLAGDARESGYARLDELAQEAPSGSHGVIFTPWLYGERAPIEDGTVRGGFHNLSLGTTRQDMVRAVFEGVALNTRWGFMYTERFVHRRLDNIRAIGGGARSAPWCQIFADVFGRTIDQVDNPGLCNVRGAALQAAASLGYTTFDGISERTPVTAAYRPDPANRQLYDELFVEFVHLYHRNKSIYARLNRRREMRA
jgi:xylulokinase